jgi:hypothetical protein
MPDTNAEYEKYSGSINVIDGQHRLLAFREDMRHPEFKDNTPFQMTFTIFEEPAKEEIKQLFIVTNDEQDKVPSNLLRMFKKILGIFDQDDETLYDITKALSDENFSPLYGRIMVGAKRISKGYKEQQISKMLKGSGINKSIYDDVNGDITTVSKVISNYLKAWEKTENVSFGTPGKETITKISGLRYILYMLPSVWQILKDRQIDATADNFEGIIKMLPAATGVVNVFTDEKCKPYFRGESITIDLSREHAKQISYHLKNGHSYNPAANI